MFYILSTFLKKSTPFMEKIVTKLLTFTIRNYIMQFIGFLGLFSLRIIYNSCIIFLLSNQG